MNEKSRKIALFCALGVALWWGYSNYPWQKDKEFSTEKRADVSATSPAATLTTAASKSAHVSDQIELSHTPIDPAGLEYVESKDWGIDPFYFPHKAPLPQSRGSIKPALSFSLRAVIYNETQPSAYINGKIVRTGESVDGATVTKITRRSVVLSTSEGKQQIYVRR